MTRRFRTILFLICALLLFITAPTVILYSQGYRVDFAQKKIVQTGGLYFKVTPKSVEINVKPIAREPFSYSLINKEIRKQTNFLFGSTLIENLLPATYEIEIKKQNYHDWKKTLKVEKKQVTENKNLVLIPRDPDFMFLDKNIENIWISPNNKKIIIQKNAKQNWNLEIFDIEKNEKTDLLKSKSRLSNLGSILNLEFSQDSKKILLKTLQKNSEKKIIYFVLELNSEPLLFCLDFLGQDVKNLYFSEKNSKKLFFTKQATKDTSTSSAQDTSTRASTELSRMSSVSTGQATQNKKQNNENLTPNLLFSTDYEKKEIESLIINDLISYSVADGNIIWLSKNGFIYKSDFKGKILETFNLKPIDLSGKKYEMIAITRKILLKIDNSLFFLNEKTREFQKIFDNVKGFEFSFDDKKIAFFNNSEIWIFFIEKQESQPQKKIYEKIFLTRFSEKINSCLWFTDHYLILNIGNNSLNAKNGGQTIKIMEIDDRDRINMCDLAKFENQNILFSSISKKLYVLSQGNLYSSKKLY